MVYGRACCPVDSSPLSRETLTGASARCRREAKIALGLGLGLAIVVDADSTANRADDQDHRHQADEPERHGIRRNAEPLGPETQPENGEPDRDGQAHGGVMSTARLPFLVISHHVQTPRRLASSSFSAIT